MEPLTFDHTSQARVDFLLFENYPGAAAALLPDAPRFTVVATTNDFLRSVGMKKEDVVGKGLFETFTDSPEGRELLGEKNIRAGFEYTIQHKKPYELPVQRYDIANGDGTFTERYWMPQGSPVLNEAGELLYIIHAPVEVTEQVKVEKTQEAHRELEKAYRQIEESEKKYRNLFETMEQGYCTQEAILDDTGHCIDYRFLEVNLAFENQTGIRNAAGKTIKELVPGIESFWFDIVEKVVKTGKSIRIEEESKALQRWWDIYVYRIGQNGSKVVGVLFTDITKRKLAEEALRKSESQLRTLILQAPVPMCILRGADFVVEVANQRMFELWGKPAETISGKPVFEILPEAKDLGFEQLLGRVYHNGETVAISEAAVTLLRSGSIETVYASAVYEPFREADGTVSGVIAVSVDVTEQVTARKKVEESEKQFSTLANSIVQLAWIAEPDGWIHWYNDRWYEYTGTTLEEMKGWGWEKVHHPEHIERVVAFVKEAWQRGEPWELTFPLRRYDGVYRWFLTRGVPVRNGDGKVVQWIGTNTDIDEQKSLETELEQRVKERTAELEAANQELKRSNQNLEEFAYAASHDMKEPIRKINFFADRLKGRLLHKLEEEDNRYFEKLEAGAKRMNTLIDDLLVYSHVNRGIIGVEIVDLNQVLTNVLDDLELQIDEKDARVNVGTLPTIKGHGRQLQQLFENLLGNALKYSQYDVAPVISITSDLIEGNDSRVPAAIANESKKYHLIKVQDNGIGFDQKDAERIFDVFTRLHGNAEYRGTGVGLSIAQKVVDNHGGYIWAESKPGEGATFKLLIPAA